MMTDWTAASNDDLVSALRGFGYDTPFALAQEVVRRGSGMVDTLRAVVRDPAAWGPRKAPENMLPVHALLLLGALADPRALSDILWATRTHDMEEYTSDSMPAVLAVFGPSVMPDLAALAWDPTAPVYARAAAMRAMYLVACDHPSRRDEVATALTDILRGCTTPIDDLAINVAFILEDVATAEAIAAIKDADARDMLEGEFGGVADALVEGSGWQWSTFERDPMEHFGPGGTLDHLRERKRATDAWRLAEATKRPAVTRVAPAATRAAPKVGRNDACPCGSGKKYKKCCGAASAATASTKVIRRP
jgi:hypothetical protein